MITMASPPRTLTGTRLLSGGEAAAHAMRQARPAVVPVFPITPQTPIIETFARFVASGASDAEIIRAESEHSAMSAAIGAAAAGARTMTATASQGLALMIEVVYIAASMRLPITMVVGNRALSGPINIHCDHGDGMLARDTGAIQLFVQDAQEAYDFVLMATRLAEHRAVRLPVLVEMDGFTLTHSSEPVALLDDDEAMDFLGAHRGSDPLLNVKRPVTHGPFAMPDYYYEFRRQQEAAIAAAATVWPEVAGDFAARSGRAYELLDRYRLEDAERAILLLGATAGTVKDVVDARRANGEKVGLLVLRAFRPFPTVAVRAALEGVRAVAVLDRAVSPGGPPPLFATVAAELHGAGPRLRSYVYGLGGRDLQPADVETVFQELLEDTRPGSPRHLGVREDNGKEATL